MAGSKVLSCNCKDEQQDAMYGKGLRLHNLSPDKKTAYCTVCSMNNIKRKMQDPKPPKGGKPVRD